MPKKKERRKEGKREGKREKGGLRNQRLLRPSPEPRLAERSREPCQVSALCLTCCFPPGQQQKENNLFLLLPELLSSIFKFFSFFIFILQVTESVHALDLLPPLLTNSWSGATSPQTDATESCRQPLSPLLHLSRVTGCFQPLVIKPVLSL